MKIIFTIISALILYNSSFSQNVSIGIIGNYFTKFEQKSSSNSITKNYNMFTYGVDARISSIFYRNVSSGITIQYGSKSLFSYIPKPVPDVNVGSLFGSSRDIQMFLFELPFYYEMKINKSFWLNGGLKFGIGYLKMHDKFTYYRASDASVSSSNNYSLENYKFYLGPLLEINYDLLYSIYLTLGIEYKYLNYSLKYESSSNEDLDLIPIDDPNTIKVTLPDIYFKYNFNNLNYFLSIKYNL